MLRKLFTRRTTTPALPAQRTRKLKLETLECRHLLATFIVDTLVDENDGNYSAGDFSLREALVRSNSTTTVDTINFKSTLNGTITLTGATRMRISRDVTIQGSGANRINIDANQASQHFYIEQGVNANINNLTLSRGAATGGVSTGGGSIENAGILVLERCYINNNVAGFGGAIYNRNTGFLVIESSTIANNRASYTGGGGISNNGTLYVANSTISNNYIVDYGGGIRSIGSATITNSTIANNRVDDLGLFASGGGGISAPNGNLTLNNSILAGNTRGPGFNFNDIHGTVSTINSHSNIVSDIVHAGGLTNGVQRNIIGNFGLGNLAASRIISTNLENHGGFIPVHKLVSNSPAIDAADDFYAKNYLGEPFAFDERGVDRFADGNRDGVYASDIGAMEVHNPVISSLGGTISYTEGAPATLITTTAFLTDVDNSNFGGGKLTISLTVNAEAGDRLAIKTIGSGTGQINVVGSQIKYGSIVIGTFTGGTGTTPLAITFKTSATVPAVQALIRAITYRTVASPPSQFPRVVAMQLNDGDAGLSLPVNKQILVTAVNDPPVLGGINGAVNYTRNALGIVVATQATVSDPDNTDSAGGKLTVKIVSGASTSNRLYVSGNNFTTNSSNIFYNGVLIASTNVDAGIGTTKLELTFTGNATTAIVQQLLRSIRFKTIFGIDNTPRVISFTLTDGVGGTSNIPRKTVNVLS